jgi:hypothetical protein
MANMALTLSNGTAANGHAASGSVAANGGLMNGHAHTQPSASAQQGAGRAHSGSTELSDDSHTHSEERASKRAKCVPAQEEQIAGGDDADMDMEQDPVIGEGGASVIGEGGASASGRITSVGAYGGAAGPSGHSSQAPRAGMQQAASNGHVAFAGLREHAQAASVSHGAGEGPGSTSAKQRGFGDEEQLPVHLTSGGAQPCGAPHGSSNALPAGKQAAAAARGPCGSEGGLPASQGRRSEQEHQEQVSSKQNGVQVLDVAMHVSS